MFIVSAKMTKARIAMILGGLLAVLLLFFWVIPSCGKSGGDAQGNAQASGVNLQNAAVKTNQDRVALLKSLGWECGSQPVEFVEVLIPATFTDVYMKYNQIQKDQGFDLEGFKGKRVMRYTYAIENHPSGDARVQATLLVYKDALIGGDVYSVKLDGFMHGLKMPASSGTAKIGGDDIEVLRSGNDIYGEEFVVVDLGDDTIYPVD